MTRHLQDQHDDGTSLLGVVRGEDHFGDPFRHLVEPGDDVADVRGQLKTVLLGPFLLQKLTAVWAGRRETERRAIIIQLLNTTEEVMICFELGNKMVFHSASSEK